MTVDIGHCIIGFIGSKMSRTIRVIFYNQKNFVLNGIGLREFPIILQFSTIYIKKKVTIN